MRYQIAHVLLPDNEEFINVCDSLDCALILLKRYARSKDYLISVHQIVKRADDYMFLLYSTNNSCMERVVLSPCN